MDKKEAYRLVPSALTKKKAEMKAPLAN